MNYAQISYLPGSFGYMFAGILGLANGSISYIREGCTAEQYANLSVHDKYNMLTYKNLDSIQDWVTDTENNNFPCWNTLSVPELMNISTCVVNSSHHLPIAEGGETRTYFYKLPGQTDNLYDIVIDASTNFDLMFFNMLYKIRDNFLVFKKEYGEEVRIDMMNKFKAQLDDNTVYKIDINDFLYLESFLKMYKNVCDYIGVTYDHNVIFYVTQMWNTWITSVLFPEKIPEFKIQMEQEGYIEKSYDIVKSYLLNGTNFL